MDYTAIKQPIATGYSDAATSLAPSGSLAEAIGRIHASAQAAREIGYKMCQHADALYGSLPEGASASKPQEVRSGLIGGLFDALDALDDAQSFMAMQAGRNAGLV